MKKVLVIVAAFATVFTSCMSGGEGTRNVTITTAEDSLVNALGITMAAQIKQVIGDNKVNADVLAAAFEKALLIEDDKALETEYKAAENVINNYVSVVVPARKLADGKAFLAKEENKENVLKTESGLLYEITEPGDAELRPTAADEVVVHYKGTKIDGTEFDSSYKRNQPATFMLSAVIPGWTEGLQLIGKGGKMRLVIPSELAYSNNPRSPLANEVLIFEVELLDVKKK